MQTNISWLILKCLFEHIITFKVYKRDIEKKHFGNISDIHHRERLLFNEKAKPVITTQNWSNTWSWSMNYYQYRVNVSSISSRYSEGAILKKTLYRNYMHNYIFSNSNFQLRFFSFSLTNDISWNDNALFFS